LVRERQKKLSCEARRKRLKPSEKTWNTCGREEKKRKEKNDARTKNSLALEKPARRLATHRKLLCARAATEFGKAMQETGAEAPPASAHDVKPTLKENVLFLKIATRNSSFLT
jgi:hypothetical protein